MKKISLFFFMVFFMTFLFSFNVFAISDIFDVPAEFPVSPDAPLQEEENILDGKYFYLVQMGESMLDSNNVSDTYIMKALLSSNVPLAVLHSVDSLGYEFYQLYSIFDGVKYPVTLDGGVWENGQGGYSYNPTAGKRVVTITNYWGGIDPYYTSYRFPKNGNYSDGVLSKIRQPLIWVSFLSLPSENYRNAYDHYMSTAPIFSSEAALDAYAADGSFGRDDVENPDSPVLSGYDSSLDLDINSIKYGKTVGDSFSRENGFFISWDGDNPNYDDDTFLSIHVDFGYAKDVFSDWQYFKNSLYLDDILANSSVHTFLANDYWDVVFRPYGLKRSIFASYLTETYYLQVIKYNSDSDSYSFSKIYALSIASSGGSFEVVGGNFDDSGGFLPDGDSLSSDTLVVDGGEDLPDVDLIEDSLDSSAFSSGNVAGIIFSLANTFLSSIGSISGLISELPVLISKIFVFIPSPIISLIGLNFLVAMFLRILGR